MPYISISADDFEDDELIDELKSRGYLVDRECPDDIQSMLMEIYLLRRRDLSYDLLLDKMIYEILGKVV